MFFSNSNIFICQRRGKFCWLFSAFFFIAKIFTWSTLDLLLHHKVPARSVDLENMFPEQLDQNVAQHEDHNAPGAREEDNDHEGLRRRGIAPGEGSSTRESIHSSSRGCSWETNSAFGHVDLIQEQQEIVNSNRAENVETSCLHGEWQSNDNDSGLSSLARSLTFHRSRLLMLLMNCKNEMAGYQ